MRVRPPHAVCTSPGNGQFSCHAGTAEMQRIRVTVYGNLPGEHSPRRGVLLGKRTGMHVVPGNGCTTPLRHLVFLTCITASRVAASLACASTLTCVVTAQPDPPCNHTSTPRNYRWDVHASCDQVKCTAVNASSAHDRSVVLFIRDRRRYMPFGTGIPAADGWLTAALRCRHVPPPAPAPACAPAFGQGHSYKLSRRLE